MTSFFEKKLKFAGKLQFLSEFEFAPSLRDGISCRYLDVVAITTIIDFLSTLVISRLRRV
ncbi:hypothetical protein CKA32_004521 [Geitlerinema sp. FC II]|nr:hypothetical protein CKA32_004521 [Geitlerinema sp. FC II]